MWKKIALYALVAVVAIIVARKVTFVSDLFTKVGL
jgi:hypothetical protein